MIEYYSAIKSLHTHLALLSIAGFIVRWVLLLLRSPFANIKPLRIIPHLVDSLLLIAALLLCVILHQYPLQQAWLTAKVAYLLVYILCGMLALRHAPSQKVRLVMGLVAILVFAQLVMVAMTKQPFGLLTI